MNKCLNCGNPVKNKYCNTSCQNIYQGIIRRNNTIIVSKICEYCKNEFKQTIIAGQKNPYIKKCCSIKCARALSTRDKRKEINKKVSKKLTKPKYYKKCLYCGKEFESNGNKRYCSISCSMKHMWQNKEYRKKMSTITSITAIQTHKNNPNFGWQTRKKLKPSYPESIAIRKLNEMKIDYEREYKFHKYFIDFVLHKEKIAIEIDGQQHKKPERKKIDKIKDKLLIQEGWKIFRIKYPEENIRQEISKIIKIMRV